MRSNSAAALIVALPGLLLAPTAGTAKLQYVIIISRHGVRSPTWDPARLNQYSAQPWPGWGVAPGELTPHGRDLMKIMGGYYREWLTGENLYSAAGCGDAHRIYIWADSDHRTVDTGRALAESLLPGCDIAVHSQPDGSRDPIFAGVGDVDPTVAARAVRERMGPEPEKLISDHAAALAALRFILGEKASATKWAESQTEVTIRGNSVILTGPFATGSSLSEDLLLEYTNGMTGVDLGWGRLTKENLFKSLELHTVYANLMRRTPTLARLHSSNLLLHVLCSMQQAVSGRPVPGALDNTGGALLVLSGHDTNLSNISGMLGLSWNLPGYQPDDTPPGGALMFCLWRGAGDGQYTVSAQYVVQTLDQMRTGEQLTMVSPPPSQKLAVPGCDAVSPSGCSWRDFELTLQKAIDPTFTTLADPDQPRRQMRPNSSAKAH